MCRGMSDGLLARPPGIGPSAALDIRVVAAASDLSGIGHDDRPPTSVRFA
jgi:hypothetical protein